MIRSVHGQRGVTKIGERAVAEQSLPAEVSFCGDHPS